MRVSHEVGSVLILIATYANAFSPTVHQRTVRINNIIHPSPIIQSVGVQIQPQRIKYTTSSLSSTTQNEGKSIDILEEANAIFDSIDTNGDGAITSDELSNHLVDQMGYSIEYTKYLFEALDTDDDGSITREEFRYAFYSFEALSMYMTFGVGGSEVTSREAFKSFALSKGVGGGEEILLNDLADLIFDMIDTDKSGEITKAELKAHFENVTNKFEDEESTESQAKDYVRTMFATFDANIDGSIDREEVREAFQKYDFKLLAQTFGLRVYRER